MNWIVTVAKVCNKLLKDRDIVTSCEFCEIGIMHEICATNHIFDKHNAKSRRKLNFTKKESYTIINKLLLK